MSKGSYTRRMNDLAEEREELIRQYKEASEIYARKLEQIQKKMTKHMHNVRQLHAEVFRDTAPDA